MKNLITLLYEHQDALGHELQIGDFVKFNSAGISPYGQIQDITNDDKPKYIVRTLGWFGDENKKPKDKYKVNVDAKHVCQINLHMSDKQLEQLKKDKIII